MVWCRVRNKLFIILFYDILYLIAIYAHANLYSNSPNPKMDDFNKSFFSKIADLFDKYDHDESDEGIDIMNEDVGSIMRSFDGSRVVEGSGESGSVEEGSDSFEDLASSIDSDYSTNSFDEIYETYSFRNPKRSRLLTFETTFDDLYERHCTVNGVFEEVCADADRQLRNTI